MFAGVREGSSCAQIGASLSALYRSISLFVVGVATWVATQMFLERDLPWLAISTNCLIGSKVVRIVAVFSPPSERLCPLCPRGFVQICFVFKYGQIVCLVALCVTMGREFLLSVMLPGPTSRYIAFHLI